MKHKLGCVHTQRQGDPESDTRGAVRDDTHAADGKRSA